MTASNMPLKVLQTLMINGLPHLGNGGLEGSDICMKGSTGLAFNVPPDGEVQGVEVGALGRPEGLRLEGPIALHPLLDHVGHIGHHQSC
jgi:hypothetical protein